MEAHREAGALEAGLNLVAWHDVARWLDYAAEEFIPDAITRGYLHHVGPG